MATTEAEVARLAAAASSLDELAGRVSVCRACPRLVAWRETVAARKRRSFADQPYWGRPVPSFGNLDPRVLVVGLDPAAHGGNRTGRMFTGDRSGDWIFAALHRAGHANQPTAVAAGDGLRLTGARIVAPVHCAPPDNKPDPAERITCGHWLDRELLMLAGCGRSWCWAASPGSRCTPRPRGSGAVPRPRVRFGHGAQTVFVAPDGRHIKVVGCYHVSQQNTFTGKLTEQMLDAVIAQL